MIVDLLPTDDQALIADSVAGFFASTLPVDRLRDAGRRRGAAERGAWSDLAALGLFGLGVPVDAGGVGYSLAEEVIVAQLAGLNLLSPTVIATMIAAHGGNAAPYADGRRVAFAQPRSALASSGKVDAQLIDAEACDELLYLSGGSALLVPRAAVSAPKALGSIDEMVSLETAALDLAAGRPLPVETAVRADLLLSAYLSGVAKGALDMAVAYACTREQFGQPIGAFQAIKHACADMALRVEAASCQTCYAAALAAGADPSPALTASARILAEKAALLNGRANIQVHGGMGFTDESDAHLFLKRAHLIAALNGGKSRLRDQILAA